MIKLYKVEFMKYTNGLKDTVYDEVRNLYLYAKDLIIREDEFDFYAKYGGGFRSVEYVGIFRPLVRNGKKDEKSETNLIGEELFGKEWLSKNKSCHPIFTHNQ